MWFKIWIFLTFTTCQILAADISLSNQEANENERLGKVLPIFQVVRFPNDVCTGSTRNGTCYTAEECSSKSGTNEGSCASGFGVCCVFKASCGGTITANNSYIVQSAVTTLTSPCTYKVCPCSTDICRIRYDFTTNTLANQDGSFTAVASTAATTATAPLPSASQVSHSAGSCIIDQMSISAPGSVGSPIICGTNGGQHMIIDSTGTECQTVNVNIGASTTVSRTWDIYVTQFTCGQQDISGPPGCLQFYTGATGLIKNFGFPSSYSGTAAPPAASTHLADQLYSVCMRREKGMCYICYAPWYINGAMGTFGLSQATAIDDSDSLVGSDCIDDYITIPMGTTAAIAAITTPVAGLNRYCGRNLNTVRARMDAASVCSRAYPFTLKVRTDDHEDCIDTALKKANICEYNGLPSGTLGFALGFEQKSC